MPRPEVVETARTLAEHFGSESFTAVDAQRAGIPAHRLWSAAGSGVLLRVRRGTYRVSPFGGGNTSVPGLTEAQLASVEDRVSCLRESGIQVAMGGMTAAEAWQLPTWKIPRASVPVLYVPRYARVRFGVQAGVRLTPRDLDPARVVEGPGGMPVTDPGLTAVHLAASSRLVLAARLVALHGGLRRQWEWTHFGLTRPDGRTLADAVADPDCRARLLADARSAAEGADVQARSRVVRALAIADPRIETALESISWAEFFRAQLIRPEPQARIQGASGTVWRVDFLFGDRVIGECDGAVKYHAGYTPWEEKRRQSDLEAAGYIVVRWTWDEIVYRPQVVLARIDLALSRAAQW